MASHAGHHSRSEDQPGIGYSDLIAKPLIKGPGQNLALWYHKLPSGNPTRDPGADQMISRRDAGAVKIVRSDETLLWNTAHGGAFEPLRSQLSPHINNAREHVSGFSILIGRHRHYARENHLVCRCIYSSCLRHEHTHFTYRSFLPKNNRRTSSPATFRMHTID